MPCFPGELVEACEEQLTTRRFEAVPDLGCVGDQSVGDGAGGVNVAAGEVGGGEGVVEPVPVDRCPLDPRVGPECDQALGGVAI